MSLVIRAWISKCFPCQTVFEILGFFQTDLLEEERLRKRNQNKQGRTQEQRRAAKVLRSRSAATREQV